MEIIGKIMRESMYRLGLQLNRSKRPVSRIKWTCNLSSIGNNSNKTMIRISPKTQTKTKTKT